MTAATRLRYLRFALILVGLIFIFGVYPVPTENAVRRERL
jgi:hypothetical protein